MISAILVINTKALGRLGACSKREGERHSERRRGSRKAKAVRERQIGE